MLHIVLADFESNEQLKTQECTVGNSRRGRIVERGVHRRLITINVPGCHFLILQILSQSVLLSG